MPKIMIMGELTLASVPVVVYLEAETMLGGCRWGRGQVRNPPWPRAGDARRELGFTGCCWSKWANSPWASTSW